MLKHFIVTLLGGISIVCAFAGPAVCQPETDDWLSLSATIDRLVGEMVKHEQKPMKLYLDSVKCGNETYDCQKEFSSKITMAFWTSVAGRQGLDGALTPANKGTKTVAIQCSVPGKGDIDIALMMASGSDSVVTVSGKFIFKKLSPDKFRPIESQVLDSIAKEIIDSVSRGMRADVSSGKKFLVRVLTYTGPYGADDGRGKYLTQLSKNLSNRIESALHHTDWAEVFSLEESNNQSRSLRMLKGNDRTVFAGVRTTPYDVTVEGWLRYMDGKESISIQTKMKSRKQSRKDYAFEPVSVPSAYFSASSQVASVWKDTFIKESTKFTGEKEAMVHIDVLKYDREEVYTEVTVCRNPSDVANCDQLKFVVAVKNPLYLYIYNKTKEGGSVLLYPKRSRDNRLVPSTSQYLIAAYDEKNPLEDAGWYVGGNGGEEVVTVFALSSGVTPPDAFRGIKQVRKDFIIMAHDKGVRLYEDSTFFTAVLPKR